MKGSLKIRLGVNPAGVLRRRDSDLQITVVQVRKFDDFIVWNKVKGYKDFGGIRNEEDWLVTGGGARRLGTYIPLTADEVEAIRRG